MYQNVLAGHSCSAYSHQKCPGRTFSIKWIVHDDRMYQKCPGRTFLLCLFVSKCPGRTFLCFRFSLLVLEETTVSSCILQAISPVSKRPVFREQSCVEDALPSRTS